MRNILILLVMFSESFGEVQYSSVFTNGTSEILTLYEKPFVYEEVLSYYRSDTRKREPQFLGFDIQDDNIEIDMEIAVPFLSVPTSKGLSKKRKFANINVAAVMLAGIVAIGGTLLGGAARFFRGDKFFDGPIVRTGNKKKKSKRDVHEDDFVWEIFNKIDNALLQIDFDVTACAQRSICWHVKNSLLNIKENRSRKVDKFIEGFVNADWTHRIISNSKWQDAVDSGKKGINCENRFKTCVLNSNNLESFSKKIQDRAKHKNKSFFAKN